MKLNREFKIGCFVLTVLAVSFFVINFLRGKDIFNREISIAASYDNVEGLVPSDPVYIKGYKAGNVSSVEYNPETDRFDVICSVLKKFRIPADSKMTIYSRDIMGGKAIRIDQGKSSGNVSDGDSLASDVQPDMLASVAEQITPLLSRVSDMVENLDSVTSSVNSVLSRENRDGIASIIQNLERTVAEAEKISSAVGDRSGELGLFIDNLTQLGGKLDSIAVKADKSMSDVNTVTAALSRSDIEGLAVSFKELLESMRNPDGTFGRLLSEDEIYESVSSLVEEADSLLKKIQENPKKYIRISVF